MKKIIFAILLCAIFCGVTMGIKVTHESFVNLDDIKAELSLLDGKTVIVGVQADENSHLAKYAAANEFGAEITATKTKFLAIPLDIESKGKSPREFSNLFFVPGKHDGYGFLARADGDKLKRLFILKKSVKIPERAFIRTAINNKATWKLAETEVAEALERLLSGKITADGVCVALGESLKAAIKNSIASNIGPSNSPLTRSLKGSNQTLIDSGDLLKSINYEIV